MEIDMEKWKAMSPNKKGSIAEIMACTWLLLQGYDVFKNVSAWGAADIIAMKAGEVILIDVAISLAHSDSKLACASQRQKQGHNIRFLYVMPDGTCKWRDDAFKMEKRVCLSCGNKYDIKERSMRRKCDTCSRVGREIIGVKGESSLTVKQRYKQKITERLIRSGELDKDGKPRQD